MARSAAISPARSASIVLREKKRYFNSTSVCYLSCEDSICPSLSLCLFVSLSRAASPCHPKPSRHVKTICAYHINPRNHAFVYSKKILPYSKRGFSSMDLSLISTEIYCPPLQADCSVHDALTELSRLLYSYLSAHEQSTIYENDV